MEYSKIKDNLSPRDRNKILNFPLKISLLFIIFTEIFLFIGPINFVVKSPFLLILFLFIVNMALYKGYKCGLKAKVKNTNLNIANHGLVFAKYAIVIGLTLAPVKFFVGWHMDSFSVQEIFNKILFGLLSPGDVYFESVELRGVDNSSIFSLILMIFSPFLFVSIPLGVFFYLKLPTRFKMMVIFLILLQIMYTLGSGTRKGLLDVILFISFPFILANPQILISSKKKFHYIIISILLLSGLLFYFFYSTMSRSGIDSISEIGATRHNIREFYVNHIPNEIYYPLTDVHVYLSHSYSNLSIILEKSFYLKNNTPVFTYGLGNNLFTIKLAKDFFGVDLLKKTHQGLLEQSHFVDPLASWHSIYSWIANDFTFWGCPLLIFFIGYFFGKTWKEVLSEGNLFSFPFFSLLTISVFYFFANNQVVSFSFISFIFITVMYFISNRRWKI